MKVTRKRGLVATVIAVVGIVLAVTGLVGADVGQPYRSSSDVLAFADPRTPVGESVTAWWVVLNQSENCTNPACDTDDILRRWGPEQPAQ